MSDYPTKQESYEYHDYEFLLASLAVLGLRFTVSVVLAFLLPLTLLVGYCQYGTRISLVTSRAPGNIQSGLWLWGKGVLAVQGQCKVSTLTWLHMFSELRSILFHANGN